MLRRTFADVHKNAGCFEFIESGRGDWKLLEKYCSGKIGRSGPQSWAEYNTIWSNAGSKIMVQVECGQSHFWFYLVACQPTTEYIVRVS